MGSKSRTVGWTSRAFVVAAVVALTGVSIPAWAEPGGTDRPYGGRCDTTITQVSPVDLEIAGACHLLHLGLTTASTAQQVIPTGPPVGSLLDVAIFNTTTYVAANGDTLESAFSGSGVVNLATGEATFHGTEIFLGGSGRFATATGSAFTEGAASLVTSTGSFTVQGTISY